MLHNKTLGGIILAACLLCQGCAHNPVAVATDLSQRAYALYGTFVIVEHQAAIVITDPTVVEALKPPIQQADAKAKPTADALVQSLRDYESARGQMGAAHTTAAQLDLATQTLNTWITQAQTDINALVSAVHSVPQR